MPVQSSVLCSIPAEVLENIALELTVLDAVGPPSDLIPLLLTCRHIHDTLRFDHCRQLYARIFRCKFDTRAAGRRMGVRATFTSNIAMQLKKLSVALKRIRSGDIYSEHLLDDMWTAVIMCLENDGKNQDQLDWAGLDRLVNDYVRTRLWEDRELYHSWPAESTLNALAIWLVWFRLDEAKLAALTAAERKQLMDLVRPYVLTALRYPSFHAPDNHFRFPLPEELKNPFPYTLTTPHGFYPLYRQPSMVVEKLVHFNLPLEIAPPLIAQMAKLLYMTLSDFPFAMLRSLPVNREHAIQLGRTHVAPTQADITEVNAHSSVKLIERGQWDWRSQLTQEEGKLEDDYVWRKGLRAKSAAWDNDWERLVCCGDPWNVPELKGVVYTYGTLDGLWQGRLLVPDISQYSALVTSVDFPEGFSEQNPRLITYPVFMRLREHHCVNPEFPVLPGGSHDGLDDGVRNGWFPDITYREVGGIIRVEDRDHHLVSRYETYVEGRPNSHSEDTCTQCGRRKEDEEADLMARVRTNADASMHVESEADNRSFSPDRRRRLTSSSRSAQCSPSRLSPFAADSSESDSSESHADTESDAEEERMRMSVNEALGPDTSIDELLESEMEHVPGDPDEQDDFEEFISNECNGVHDIIVTGETLPRHGQAWNHFLFYGRIRTWDGLIAIVRVPAHNPLLGVYIFRGYIVANKNFVGSWRARTGNAHAIPLEGPFVLSKV
ncbi:hypothetical protein AcV5_002729 [Taiwanofungus camphoratus]|nr:hypothetical protein AcV5_002729 [Antrodia cinnamomea]KAI0917919.1 hypothetical protein AcV5_002729 [Antrodia cinnamomea]